LEINQEEERGRPEKNKKRRNIGRSVIMLNRTQREFDVVLECSLLHRMQQQQQQQQTGEDATLHSFSSFQSFDVMIKSSSQKGSRTMTASCHPTHKNKLLEQRGCKRNSLFVYFAVLFVIL
jgi:hypothetical protein